MINLTVEDIVRMGNIPNKVSFSNDFCIIDFRYSPEFDDFLKYPCCFDGVIVFFCKSGHFKITVNLKEVEIGKDSLFVSMPNSIVSVSEFTPESIQELHFIVVAVSTEYLSGLKLDVNYLFTEGMKIMDTPSAMLSEKEKELASYYLELVNKIMEYPSPFKKKCIDNVISSMCYLIATAWHKKRIDENGSIIPSRKKALVSNFLHLVIEWHASERTVGFYADKMCLTPKYLSKLIKNATGRSAPDWIDSFVILEAKNMLKYSNMPIKEIVARLNFPNQSVFHKFFKAHVGMTPGEYRNS